MKRILAEIWCTIAMTLLMSVGCARQSTPSTAGLPRSTTPCAVEPTVALDLVGKVKLLLPKSLVTAQPELIRINSNEYHYSLNDHLGVSFFSDEVPNPYHLFVQRYLGYTSDLDTLSKLGMPLDVSPEELEIGEKQRSMKIFTSSFDSYGVRAVEDRFILGLRAKRLFEFHVVDDRHSVGLVFFARKGADLQTVNTYFDVLACNVDVEMRDMVDTATMNVEALEFEQSK